MAGDYKSESAAYYSGQIFGNRATVDWIPIDDIPEELEGKNLLLWLEEGERGNGEIAVGMVIRNRPEGTIDCYWTWGGANSGSDINEAPTHYALLPFAPNGKVHG